MKTKIKCSWTIKNEARRKTVSEKEKRRKKDKKKGIYDKIKKKKPNTPQDLLNSHQKSAEWDGVPPAAQ